MKTNNMKIREYFKSVDDYATRIFSQDHSDIDESKKSFYYIYFNCNINNNLKNILCPIGENSFREFVVQTALISMVIFTDAFVYLRAKEKSGDISTDEHYLLFQIMLGIVSNDFKDILKDINSLEYCIKISEKYIEESALKKIEYAKALDKEDVEKLSKFNIYFEEEYNHYNIEITEEFLLKHLNIWVKRSGLEEGINTITGFILNLFILKSEEFDSIAKIIVPDKTKRIEFMEAINSRDMDSISAYISSFYEAHKIDNRNLK